MADKQRFVLNGSVEIDNAQVKAGVFCGDGPEDVNASLRYVTGRIKDFRVTDTVESFLFRLYDIELAKEREMKR